MKYYLLIAGDQYYPRFGSGDWIATFETFEEAAKEIKGSEGTGPYGIRGRSYDWYTIINLSEWINEDNENES